MVKSLKLHLDIGQFLILSLSLSLRFGASRSTYSYFKDQRGRRGTQVGGCGHYSDDSASFQLEPEQSKLGIG